MNAEELTGPQRKLVMWYKVNELKSKGLKDTQISHELGIHRHTVAKYSSMSQSVFEASGSYQRSFPLKLDVYEEEVKDELARFPYLSSAQISDHLRERHSDFPAVSAKTVFNYVQHIRKKYSISKSEDKRLRPYEMLPQTAPGDCAQVDFGEYWMHTDDSRRVKVYFFAMVMCYSRRKFVYFSRMPFTSALAIYAHELAFRFYGGKPCKLIYDQDKVLLHSENLGDLILTRPFQAFVQAEHIECVFCRKSDPESKGKVENVVKYVKYNFLRGREFIPLDKLNESALRWLGRTANGLPHATTKRIPDEYFKDECPYLQPYNGIPTHPQDGMKEYMVRKNNTISFRSHYYNVPTGTYHGDGSLVWVSCKDNWVEIFSNETGKMLVRHPLSCTPGEVVIDESILRPKSPSTKELGNYILAYLDGSPIVAMWLKNLYELRPRYFRSNIRYLNQKLELYSPESLIKSFEICLDKGDYNASDLIKLCEKKYGQVQKSHEGRDLEAVLPQELLSAPERSDIENYKKILL